MDEALGPGSEDAELVALGIAQHLPAPASVDIVGPRSTECQSLRNRRGEITAAHVQMQTVRACFQLGHRQEIEREVLRGVQCRIALGVHLTVPLSTRRHQWASPGGLVQSIASAAMPPIAVPSSLMPCSFSGPAMGRPWSVFMQQANRTGWCERSSTSYPR